MDPARLTDLGLTVRSTEIGTEAELELQSALVNPLTRNFLTRVTFSVVGERLVAFDPPELVGIAPMSVEGLERASQLEETIHASFHEHIFHMQRRSAELQQLGLSATVDPVHLSVTSELVSADGFRFVIESDKRGNFRVQQAEFNGRQLDTSAGHAFELSEFREKAQLIGYLVALFEAAAGTKPSAKRPPQVVLPEDAQVHYLDLAEQFGPGAVVPPHSAVEVLVELEVEGQLYRFAAARVRGRIFRGLLAGSAGKVWAERFDLDEFPGVVALVADLLRVPQEAVRAVAPAGRAKGQEA